MTINRYIVEGALRDIKKGRRVLVVLDRPLVEEIPRLWDIIGLLKRDDPDLVEGVIVHKTNGKESLTAGDGAGGAVRFVTSRTPDRSRGWTYDVLVSTGDSLNDDQRAALMVGMYPSSVREVIR